MNLENNQTQSVLPRGFLLEHSEEENWPEDRGHTAD